MNTQSVPVSTTFAFQPVPAGQVRLLPSQFLDRWQLNRQYMLSLKTECLLQNYYLEAGLWQPRFSPENCHGGWESPTCQLRGHFLGHWLSAAAMLTANTGDPEVGGKAAYIVSELARCQRENGGEWAGSIPEKYLDWVVRGKKVWAPQYTLHKTLMGLVDMYAFTGNQQAMEILEKWSDWFFRWTNGLSPEQLGEILDVETGGMLEVWADLYGVTGSHKYRALMECYDRRKLFDPLLAGVDNLTNMHANTTVPEVQGAVRAWEVTGDERWREIAEAYWRSAVTQRGYYCTGGQTNGEIWTPASEFSTRLGDKTQEHCVVYNMMRLAKTFLTWTGEASYADYWERNLYNGTLAQQHPDDGRTAYWLPLRSGAVKQWGTPTQNFWCCHGTSLQAHTIYTNNIFFQDKDGLILSQYIPSDLRWEHAGQAVKVTLVEDPQLDHSSRPESMAYRLSLTCDSPQEFTLKFRIPWWVSEKPAVFINGVAQDVPFAPSSFVSLDRVWASDEIRMIFPRRLAACALPDRPEMVAFMDGPVVLAGLLDHGDHHAGRDLLEEWTLVGDPADPSSILTPDNVREWTYWRGDYRTHGQARNIQFVPLHAVRDERYGVYFPIKSA